jgi:hypothetical protein
MSAETDFDTFGYFFSAEKDLTKKGGSSPMQEDGNWGKGW